MAAAAASSSAKPEEEVVKTADEVAAELAEAERELSRPQKLAQKVYECGLADSIVPAAEKATIKADILSEVEAKGEGTAPPHRRPIPASRPNAGLPPPAGPGPPEWARPALAHRCARPSWWPASRRAVACRFPPTRSQR